MVHTIVSEYGTADPDLLEKRLKEMRILENIDLPAAFADLFVKTKESTDVVPDDELENCDEEGGPVDEELESEQEDDVLKEEKEAEAVQELPQLVRMANLCVVGSHAVNGVAEIHSEIVTNEVFNEFYKVKCWKFYFSIIYIYNLGRLKFFSSFAIVISKNALNINLYAMVFGSYGLRNFKTKQMGSHHEGGSVFVIQI